MTITSRVTTILKQYVSERVPKKATNIFWQMFNGIEAMFLNLEYRLDIVKRERNILKAQHLSSLRNLSAQNGFEPTLKIPSKGLLKIKVNPKLFNRCGYPLFIPPYSVFIDKVTKLNYYYNSEKAFRLDNNNLVIPVIEGEIKTINKVASSDIIDKFYLQDDNIAEQSITVTSDGITYQHVKSFFDNENVNDNKQFLIKFSSDIQNPILIYIKGLKYQNTVNITYRLTSGELGNIEGKHDFETTDIVDNIGSEIDAGDDEILIINMSGFEFGSNGTDENSLRSAIGYNHGNNLLYDLTSYRNFIGKYSTLMLQKLEYSSEDKKIINISCHKKQSLNISANNYLEYVKQYKQIVLVGAYLLSKAEKINLSEIIEKYEYALTSHNLTDPVINKFAFQITFMNQTEMNKYSGNIQEIFYREFIKFMYITNYSFNVENTLDQFQIENNIKVEYIIFNQEIESKKISEKTFDSVPYIIKNDEYLPILKGDFNICDSSLATMKLFFDLNIVTKE